MSIYQSELKTLVRLSLVENVVLFWRYWCFGWCFLRLHFQILIWKPIWSHPDPSLIFQSRILEKKPLTVVYMKWIRIFRAWTRNQNKTPKNEKLQRTIRTVQKDDPNLRTKSQFSLHVAVDGVLLLYKWLMQSVFVRSFIRSFELAFVRCFTIRIHTIFGMASNKFIWIQCWCTRTSGKQMCTSSSVYIIFTLRLYIELLSVSFWLRFVLVSMPSYLCCKTLLISLIIIFCVAAFVIVITYKRQSLIFFVFIASRCNCRWLECALLFHTLFVCAFFMLGFY